MVFKGNAAVTERKGSVITGGGLGEKLSRPHNFNRVSEVELDTVRSNSGRVTSWRPDHATRNTVLRKVRSTKGLMA